MNPFQLESNGSDRLLRLTGDVTVEHVRELHATLAAAVSAGTTLRIDAGAVTRLDAAAVQVLLAAARAATGAATVAASAAWAEAFQRFGFAFPALPSSPVLEPDLPCPRP